ncbi:MAG: hypothetical protein ACXW16_06375 [Burkholderiaceae bacterium]
MTGRARAACGAYRLTREFSTRHLRIGQFRRDAPYVLMGRDDTPSSSNQENMMRVDSILQKSETYLVVTVAVLLVLGIALYLSAPFSPEHHGFVDAGENSPLTSSTDSLDSQPGLLDETLQSLDGVAHHG